MKYIFGVIDGLLVVWVRGLKLGGERKPESPEGVLGVLFSPISIEGQDEVPW